MNSMSRGERHGHGELVLVIVSIDQVEELSLHLPPRCLGSIWSLAYATDQHGHHLIMNIMIIMMMINRHRHPTTRIPNSSVRPSRFSVTKKPGCNILGTESHIIKPLVACCRFSNALALVDPAPLASHMDNSEEKTCFVPVYFIRGPKVGPLAGSKGVIAPTA